MERRTPERRKFPRIPTDQVISFAEDRIELAQRRGQAHRVIANRDLAPTPLIWLGQAGESLQ